MSCQSTTLTYRDTESITQI